MPLRNTCGRVSGSRYYWYWYRDRHLSNQPASRSAAPSGSKYGTCIENRYGCIITVTVLVSENGRTYQWKKVVRARYLSYLSFGDFCNRRPLHWPLQPLQPLQLYHWRQAVIQYPFVSLLKSKYSEAGPIYAPLGPNRSDRYHARVEAQGPSGRERLRRLCFDDNAWGFGRRWFLRLSPWSLVLGRPGTPLSKEAVRLRRL